MEGNVLFNTKQFWHGKNISRIIKFIFSKLVWIFPTKIKKYLQVFPSSILISLTNLLINFNDVYPGYARDCFMFNNFYSECSIWFYYRSKHNLEVIFRLSNSQIFCPFRHRATACLEKFIRALYWLPSIFKPYKNWWKIVLYCFKLFRWSVKCLHSHTRLVSILIT